MQFSFRSFFSPQFLGIFLLGIASGLPMQLVGTTLSAWYTEAGISLLGIGALGLIGQTYVCKFLWAPWMDRFYFPRLGKKRTWLLLSQTAVLIGLVILSFFSPEKSPYLMGGIALCIAFFSATMDNAIGGYLVDAVLPKERGFMGATQIAGYRVAMITASGFALVIADANNFHIAYQCMAFCFALSMVGTFLCKEPPDSSLPLKPTEPLSTKKILLAPLTDFYQRFHLPGLLKILSLLALYKLGDAFTLSLNTTFLLRFLHFSLSEVGLANKTTGLTASILGALIGGIWMKHLGVRRALTWFCLLQTGATLGYCVLAYSLSHSLLWMMLTIFVEQFFSGFGTVALFAWMMSLCNSRFSTTQFALLSAITAIGRVYVGPVSAYLVMHLGWVAFYLICFFVGFLPLTLTSKVPT